MTTPGNERSAATRSQSGVNLAPNSPQVPQLLLLYAATIFLGAFLLFQIQPLISKAILPWFGGSAGVWTTCMLFFQTMLFLGYAYAHATSSFLSRRWQGYLHAALLVLAACLVAYLRIRPAESWKPSGDGDPILGILILLTVYVGLPFFLLSATSPLIQVWWSRAAGSETPYRLYALSNAGSLLALISYPLFVEWLIPLSIQATIWSAIFILQAILMIVSGRLFWWRPEAELRQDAIPTTDGHTAGRDDHRLEPISHRCLWIGLAAAGSGMLLSTTGTISHDIAVVPLLWIAPLSLYLLTFIICFSGWPIPRWPFIVVMLIVTSYLAFEGSGTPQWLKNEHNIIVPRFTGLADSYLYALLVYLLAMFACCMVCHGELWRLKPAPQRLTAFYLYVALGGALGGVGCGIVAPLTFPTYYEFSISMAACWFLLIASLWFSQAAKVSVNLYRWSFLGLILAFGVFAMTLAHGAFSTDQNQIARARNFYGALEVSHHYEHPEDWTDSPQEDDYRMLVNGLITHGAQFTYHSNRLIPTTYYTTDSGVGVAMESTDLLDDRIVGVVGLGVGTMAAYAMPGDYFRFYDINPDVVLFAHEYFTYLDYLDETNVPYDIAMGDARNSLERELSAGWNQNFDVLVLDAFSSDAIPLHLLTTEAFDVYLQHLRDDSKRQGIIAIHISNRYLNLLPVTQALAAHFDLDIVSVETEKEEDPELGYSSTWILLSRPGGLKTILKKETTAIPVDRIEHQPAYTDDTINLPSLLKSE